MTDQLSAELSLNHRREQANLLANQRKFIKVSHHVLPSSDELTGGRELIIDIIQEHSFQECTMNSLSTPRPLHCPLCVWVFHTGRGIVLISEMLRLDR